VARDFVQPNGLAFSPDEKKLYVADSGAPRHIRVFDVAENGTVSGGSIFCAIDKGGPDGIRVDKEGRVWSSAGDGVHIFAPDGGRIGKILVAEAPANLCFGGDDGRTLFITARKSLYSVKVGVTGAGR
jgi:gluconolactonase